VEVGETAARRGRNRGHVLTRNSSGDPAEEGDGELKQHPWRRAAREQAEDVRVFLARGGAARWAPQLLALPRAAIRRVVVVGVVALRPRQRRGDDLDFGGKRIQQRDVAIL